MNLAVDETLHLITYSHKHILLASKLAYQKVDSRGTSTENIK